LKARCEDCDAFIAVSEYYKNEMIRRLDLPVDRVFCVPNGIVLEGYAPAPAEPSPACIGYLARFCPAKGLHLLVDAFIALKRDSAFQDLTLLLVGTCTKGDKPFLNEQREKLQTAGVLHQVRIYMNVSREEKQKHLKEMTLLSVPACYGEAFGLYIIEALASGVPVVQPRRGAFKEIIEATRGGWLYDPGEKGTEATLLAECLDKALRNSEGRKKRAEEGRRIVVDRFNINVMARSVARVYEGVIGAHKRGDS
jgi:glycosyltransferase involved in cell wall biosynthesis